MSIEVRVPNLPESVADATLIAWHKNPGERVQREENLVDLETDKVVLEVPAPQDGILGQILRNAGETVSSGETLAVIEEQAVEAAIPTPVAVSTRTGTDAETSVLPPLSPSARRALAEHELAPEGVTGSGKDGRITKADVQRYAESHEEAPPAREPPAVEPARPIIEASAERPEQHVPMTRLRARIAERLVQAQQTAAILTTFNEVNLKAVMDIRNRYKERFEKAHQVKLGFMSFFVKAAVEALKCFPIVNASVDGQDIVYHGYFDIGIAVGTPRGLVVPILRDADQLNFAEIEKRIADFGARAQSGTLGYDELTGGTFTISNGGIFGSMLSTPILNPPQSAILGMHIIKERPVVEGGEIVIRPMMYLAVSYDHRIIDGRDAVQFLVHIKQRLEDPTQLLLDI